MQLCPIHSKLVPAAWAETAPFVDELIPHTLGESTAQTIFEDLLSEELQLWHIVDDSEELCAIWITEIYTERAGRKVLNWFGCAGEGAENWLHLREQIEQWAVETHGVSVGKIIGRKGWERRLPDYKPAYVGFVKRLGTDHEQEKQAVHTDNNDNVCTVGPNATASEEHPKSG